MRLLALSEESGLAVAEPDRSTGPPATAPEPAIERASATMSRPALTDPESSAAALPREPRPAEPRPPDPRPPAPALRLIDSPPRPPPPAAVPDSEVEVEEFHSTSTFETIVLEGDTFLQTEELIPQEVLDSEIANVSRRVAAAHDAAGEETGEYESIVTPPLKRPADIPPELAALREATGEFRHEANLTATNINPELWRQEGRRRSSWLMIAASVLLVLALGAQSVYHWRDDLATHAVWYGPLNRLALRLGAPLHPNWDLDAYDVRQLGAAAEGGAEHALRVRLSLANRGARAQALPLLRVTLLDRYGKALSRGELQPAQYLPESLRGQLFIDRDQRIDTEVRVQDPTQQASSFELDVCIAAAGGGLRCAGDTVLVAGTP